MPLPAIGLTPLRPAEREALVRWLGDTPFTALSAGQVLKGFCQVYAVGDPSAPRAALIHPAATPTELTALGTDVDSLWVLLSRVPGWDCVNVPPVIADEAASRLERETGMPARIIGERYYALDRDPAVMDNRAARRLGPEDAELVTRSDPLFRSFFLGHGDVVRTLAEGVVAGVVTEERLVSVVTTSAWVGSNVDLGAATVEKARRSGFATAAAHVVCITLRAMGKTPVWVAAEPNRGSWRIPEKLGFRLVGRRQWVVIEGLKPDGFQPARHQGSCSSP